MILYKCKEKGGDFIPSKAQNRATTKFIKKTYKRYELKLRKDTESDLIQELDKKESVNSYLKNLVIADMKK